MSHYSLQPEQVEYYKNALTENPYTWAGTSIVQVNELISGVHLEPTPNPILANLRNSIDPVHVATSNRNFLQNQILLFEDLGLPVPSDFQETIDKANAFLS